MIHYIYNTMCIRCSLQSDTDLKPVPNITNPIKCWLLTKAHLHDSTCGVQLTIVTLAKSTGIFYEFSGFFSKSKSKSMTISLSTNVQKRTIKKN